MIIPLPSVFVAYDVKPSNFKTSTGLMLDWNFRFVSVSAIISLFPLTINLVSSSNLLFRRQSVFVYKTLMLPVDSFCLVYFYLMWHTFYW